MTRWCLDSVFTSPRDYVDWAVSEGIELVPCSLRECYAPSKGLNHALRSCRQWLAGFEGDHQRGMARIMHALWMPSTSADTILSQVAGLGNLWSNDIRTALAQGLADCYHPSELVLCDPEYLLDRCRAAVDPALSRPPSRVAIKNLREWWIDNGGGVWASH
jgi:hypothetical protein